MLTQFEGIADRVTLRYRRKDHYDDLRQAALVGIWLALRKGITNEGWLRRCALYAVIDELRVLIGKRGQKRFEQFTARVEESMADLKSVAESKIENLLDANSDKLKLDNIVRAHCCKVLNLCNGNREHASKVLGIGRATAFRWFGDWQRMQTE